MIATLQPERLTASVVVPAYNDATRLRRCIESILSMKIPEGIEWEVICINNNSNDETGELIAALGRHSKIPVRYALERVQGSSSAINRGLMMAEGAIIAITGQDCRVEHGWLSNILDEFRNDAALGLIGGRVELHDPQDLPISTRTSNKRETFTLDRLFGLIPGCNMAFRRGILDAAGLFDPDFGAGTPLGGADDADFVYRVFKAGFAIVYSPELVVFHDHGRRTDRDAERTRRSYCRGRGAFYAKHFGDRSIRRVAYWEFRTLLRAIMTRGKRRTGLQVLRHLSSGGAAYFCAPGWRVLSARRQAKRGA